MNEKVRLAEYLHDPTAMGWASSQLVALSDGMICYRFMAEPPVQVYVQLISNLSTDGCTCPGHEPRHLGREKVFSCPSHIVEAHCYELSVNDPRFPE